MRSVHLHTQRPLPSYRVQPRIYVLTGASKYVVVAYAILVLSSLATGLWLVSVPSGKGITVTLRSFFFFLNLTSFSALQLPVTGLDTFRVCIFIASDAAEWAYRSLVALSGIN